MAQHFANKRRHQKKTEQLQAKDTVFTPGRRKLQLKSN